MLLINHNQSSNKTDCDFTKTEEDEGWEREIRESLDLL